MSDTDISDDLLNAFIDDQLDSAEKARVLEAIRTDSKLADHVQSLQNSKDMLILTYSEIYPEPIEPESKTYWPNFSSAIAATLMLTLSAVFGWVGHTYLGSSERPSMQSIAKFDTINEKNDRVLLHINSMNKARIEKILSAAENILRVHKESHKQLKLEIVANASGLGILRQGSPYRDRIQSITKGNTNVSFLACGIAMENARLKEGKDIILIPEAKKINSAIDKILGRIKGGWTYVQG